MSRLLHAGNAIVDIAFAVSALPEAGGDVLASSSSVTAGGAFNTLVAAQRDGLEAVHLGPVGTGPFADIVRSALAREEVTFAGSTMADLDTGCSVVLVDASAERTFVTRVGAEGELTREMLDRVEVEASDIVVVSGYGLAHPSNARAVPDWLDDLPTAVRVVFDPSPLIGTLPREPLERLLARADIVTANAREARLMTGAERAATGADVLLARLVEASPGLQRAAIVRDGAEGCWVATSGGPLERIPGFAITAVDTTGAGDTHCGVLCAALSRGSSLADAARRANAAAALAVAEHGAATAPTSAAIDALLAR
ncbi:MAG: sugar kinase [Frondihabitans sp.]|nr:sugar kinase [Frondihabitans sp.]